MSIRNRTTFALIVASIALPGCGGGGGSGTTPPGLATPSTTISDPVGDTVVPPGGGTLWDITQVNIPHVAAGATTLTVTATFNQTVAASDLPPFGPTFNPTQLGVNLLFSGVGGGLSQSVPCLASATFDDINYFVNGGAFGAATSEMLVDGKFPVLDTKAFTKTGEASVSFPTARSIQYQVPLASIPGATKVAVFAGNSNGLTDCAPDSSYITF